MSLVFKDIIMFNLDKFIADSVTFRPVSMFAVDIEANKDKLNSKVVLDCHNICLLEGVYHI